MNRRSKVPLVNNNWNDALATFEKSQIVAGISKVNRTERCRHIMKFAQWFDGGLDEVSTNDLQNYLDSRNITTATRRNYVKSFRAFWRWRVESGHLEQNPALELQLTFTAVEARHLDRRAKMNDDPRQYGPRPDSMPAEWEELLTAWKKYLRAGGAPETTIQTRNSQLKNLIKFLGTVAPGDVSLDDLIEWLISRDWSTEYRRSLRSTARGFFEWAELTGRIEGNPAKGIPAVRVSHSIPRPVTESAYQFALMVAQPRERLMLRLAAELGLRRAEVAAVHSRDVLELEHCRALVVSGKGRKERILPLTNSLYTDLQEFGPGWIFPSSSRSGHITPAHVGKLVSQLLPEGVTMHKLRHRFATVAYEQTGDVLAVQQVLGHSSPTTTQRYVALSRQTAENLMEKVGEVSNPATRPLRLNKSL